MNIYTKFPRFFRLLDGSKRPAISGWQNANQHIDWRRVEKRAGENYGFALPDRLIVLDIDPRNGGVESYEKILTETGLPYLESVYPSVVTASGGFHIYMYLPPNYEASQLRGGSKEYPGIDIKKIGGYVVAAGAEVKGNRYEVFNDPPKTLYAYPKLLDIFKRTENPATSQSGTRVTVDQLRGLLDLLDPSDYDTNDAWFPIMCAAHNATGGEGLETFIEWSTKDPRYAEAGGQIAYRWESLRDTENPITIGTILAQIPPEIRPSNIDTGEFEKIDTAGQIYVDNLSKRVARTHDPEELNDFQAELAKRILEKYKIIHGANDRFWLYVKTHWENQRDAMISNLILREANLVIDSKKTFANIENGTLRFLKAFCAVGYVPGQTETNGYSIINLQNGELWIDDRTGKARLKKHNPDSQLSYCLPISYNANAKCKRFDAALEQIFAKEPAEARREIIRHLWELIGLTIQGKKNLAACVLFQGRGSNGKSVILDSLTALLGPAARCLSISEIGDDAHGFAQLPGALAIIDDDLPDNVLLPSDKIKKLSENKVLTANPKYEKPFSFNQTAICWLSANTLPRTKDTSEGLKRRMHVFRFAKKFEGAEVDPYLKEKIKENELPGILNRAIAGLKRLRARGRFEMPKALRNIRDDWYGRADCTLQFARENLRPIRFNEAPFTLFSDIWDRYTTYIDEAGLRRDALSKPRLVDALANAGFPVSRKHGRLVLTGYTICDTTQKVAEPKNHKRNQYDMIARFESNKKNLHSEKRSGSGKALGTPRA